MRVLETLDFLVQIITVNIVLPSDWEKTLLGNHLDLHEVLLFGGHPHNLAP